MKYEVFMDPLLRTTCPSHLQDEEKGSWRQPHFTSCWIYHSALLTLGTKENYLFWGAVLYRMLCSVSVHHLFDACGTLPSPSGDGQKCLQTLPGASCMAKAPVAKKYLFR